MTKKKRTTIIAVIVIVGLVETRTYEGTILAPWTGEALTNIIKNASEVSPEGSIIHIEAGTNPICKWISVTDSGAGIEKSKIFNLFKRFEGSGHDKGHGVGLPLALAIMRGQNGDIEADGGGNGKGATFTLKFYK